MNKLISTLMSTNAGYGITLLRIVTGLTFAAHGAQKLFGWFGGYGLEGVAQWMESIGITPGYLMAALAGSASSSVAWRWWSACWCARRQFPCWCPWWWPR